MARNKTIKILRSTRANLNTQKNANALIEGEPYLITDERRLAVGIGNNDYEDFAKKSEIDGKKTDNVSATSRILGRKTAGSGVMEELTLSEVMDFIGSAASGDILYRGASSWVRLPKGSDGQILTLASGLPSWAAAAGGGTTILLAVKTANETVSNSTTYQDDDHLTLSVEANSNYLVEVGIFLYTSTNNQEPKVQFVMPTGATIAGGIISQYSPALDGIIVPYVATKTTREFDNGIENYQGAYYQIMTADLSVGSNAGTFKIQWALSRGTQSVTFYKGSFLRLTKR
ncbi:MAG: hypothetical protein AB1432_01580 [Bacteroidota bacterium]